MVMIVIVELLCSLCKYSVIVIGVMDGKQIEIECGVVGEQLLGGVLWISIRYVLSPIYNNIL